MANKLVSDLVEMIKEEVDEITQNIFGELIGDIEPTDDLESVLAVIYLKLRDIKCYLLA